MKSKEEIVDKLVTRLRELAHPTLAPNDTHRRLLLRAVELMSEAGCEFTDENIELMVDGAEEFTTQFGDYPGSWLLNATLNNIFEGAPGQIYANPARCMSEDDQP